MLKLFNMPNRKIKQKVQIVVTADDSILLLKLNEERGGFWQNATGSVEEHELHLDAAKRELYEETGIEAPVYELPMEIDFEDRWGFYVIEKIYHCHLHQLPDIKLSEEHQEFKWIKYKELIISDYQFENHFKAAMLSGVDRS